MRICGFDRVAQNRYAIASRVIVLSRGRLLQAGKCKVFIERPAVIPSSVTRDVEDCIDHSRFFQATAGNQNVASTFRVAGNHFAIAYYTCLSTVEEKHVRPSWKSGPPQAVAQSGRGCRPGSRIPCGVRSGAASASSAAAATDGCSAAAAGSCGPRLNGGAVGSRIILSSELTAIDRAQVNVGKARQPTAARAQRHLHPLFCRS